MTVGIGALCNGGDIAVVASDTRTLFPRSNVHPHNETGKTWDFNIPNPLIAAVAGRLGDCATVVSELNRLLGECSKKGEIFTEHVENAVRDARLKGWARCVDWEVRMAYGISLKQWQTGKVPGGKIDQFIHDSIRALIDGQPFDVELLLAGYSTRGNILFYKGSRKNPLEPGIAPGILVIGSGGIRFGEFQLDVEAPRSKARTITAASAVLCAIIGIAMRLWGDHRAWTGHGEGLWFSSLRGLHRPELCPLENCRMTRLSTPAVVVGRDLPRVRKSRRSQISRSNPDGSEAIL